MKNDFSSNFLHTKKYALFWISSLLSNIGTWMQQVAQPWVILSLHPSSFWVGFDSFSMNAPGWLFTLAGGVIADRFDRKKIVLVCQSIQFLCVLLLFILLLLAKIKIWIILVCSFLIGTTDSLSMPSFQSIIPSIVNEDDLPRAIALNSAQFNLSRILGPALAGIVIAAYGVSICYGANLLSFVPFFLSLYWIYPRGGFKKVDAELVSTPARMSHLKAILIDSRFQIPLLTVIVNSMFCGPVVVFCAVLVKTHFHGDSSDLGWAMSAIGAGGVVGGVASAFSNTSITKSTLYPNFVAIFLSLSVLFLSFTPNLIIFDSILFIIGASLTASNTTNNSKLQKLAKDHTRGRVISLFQMSLQIGLSIGSLAAGSLATYYSMKEVLFFNGSIATVLQICILYYQLAQNSTKS